MAFRVPLTLLALGLLALGAEPNRPDPSQILNAYLCATSSQAGIQNGSVSEVAIDAEVPRLHRKGRLSALRRISRLGRLTYDVLRFEGDNSVKNGVIARYLAAEVEARESADDSMAITPANYKFSYKGLKDLDGRAVHQFDLKPRKKRKGLFKGTLWIDAATYLPVRESGRFVKNPSIFIKSVEFTRNYEIRNGVALLARLDSKVQTRVVGPALMSIRYQDYRLEPATADLGQLLAGFGQASTGVAGSQ